MDKRTVLLFSPKWRRLLVISLRPSVLSLRYVLSIGRREPSIRKVFGHLLPSARFTSFQPEESMSGPAANFINNPVACDAKDCTAFGGLCVVLCEVLVLAVVVLAPSLSAKVGASLLGVSGRTALASCTKSLVTHLLELRGGTFTKVLSLVKKGCPKLLPEEIFFASACPKSISAKPVSLHMHHVGHPLVVSVIGVCCSVPSISYAKQEPSATRVKCRS